MGADMNTDEYSQNTSPFPTPKKETKQKPTAPSPQENHVTLFQTKPPQLKNISEFKPRFRLEMKVAINTTRIPTITVIQQTQNNNSFITLLDKLKSISPFMNYSI